MLVTLSIAFFLLFCIVHACFCAWIATQKNRSGLNWLFLLFFGPLAICALIGAISPLRTKSASSTKKVEGKYVEALSCV